jgi:DsbC/DsbD-like thiol-disulfide interchange protein
LPHPGSFVLDENGVVVEKWFEQAYRVRPTSAAVVESITGQPSELPIVEREAATPELRATARLNAADYRPYQKLRLEATLEIGPGLHVYGEPIPAGFFPLRLEIEPLPGLVVGSLELPEPRPHRLAGLDESFVVYDGTIRAARDFILTENLGQTTVVARIAYQACSEVDCLPPAELSIELPLTGLDHIAG